MEYRVSRTMPYPASLVWSVLEDLEHFARDDPFHTEFHYLTERKSGVGVRFSVRHTYFPAFPFAADQVVCAITHWVPERLQILLEQNRRSYRSHAQRIALTLQEQGSATLVEYAISY